MSGCGGGRGADGDGGSAATRSPAPTTDRTPGGLERHSGAGHLVVLGHQIDGVHTIKAARGADHGHDDVRRRQASAGRDHDGLSIHTQ